MKTEEIQQLFAQFESAALEIEGIECWSARELQQLLGYSKWENFDKVINKAKESCKQAGEEISNHFPDVRKMVEIGSEAREILKILRLHVMDVTSSLKMVTAGNPKLLLHKTTLLFKPVVQK